MDTVGNVPDRHVVLRTSLKQGRPHASRHLPVQRRYGIGTARQLERQHRHAEFFGEIVGIHAAEEDLLRRFALSQPASRVIANSQTSMGATGHTTALQPSMSLGCGAAAGNITSDNITPLHLINIKRLARVRTLTSMPAATAAAATARAEAVDFVCEDDVRRARREGRRIVLSARAIVTPAARDEARGSDVLVAPRE
jgi:hypothetical protein